MPNRIAFFCALTLTLLAGANGQSLTIKDENGKRVALHVEHLHAEVTLLGNVAETTVTLRFRNHTHRNQEGEFRIPLPPGATVSNYALEVNSSLREAVAVGKERARFAYETIKARNIDPGLVEREAGNVYRTRVFPIPPRGTKKLRIGYVEPLHADFDGVLHYRLPMKFPQPVDEFFCTINHTGEGKLEISSPVTFEKTNDEITLSKATNVTLDADLGLKWKKPNISEAFIQKDGDGTGWIFASGIFPSNLPQPELAKPAKIKLLWDASASFEQVEKESIYALLDQYVQAIGDLKIDLQALQFEASKPEEFTIKNGNWKSLRRRIETITYDGATNYQAISESNITTLLITDAQAPATAWKNLKASDQLFILNASKSALPPAAQFFGEVVAIGNPNALERLTLAKRTIEVTGDGLEDLEIEFDGNPGSPFRISARLTKKHAGVVDLNFAFGKERHQEGLLLQDSSSDIARRLWAQQRLQKMELLGGHPRQSIIDFARQHTLVSDLTSLIVLELFEDHVSYRIPPPEAELRQRYEAAIARRPETAWSKRLEWHKREFPWAEITLFESLSRTRIWKAATDKVFNASERDEAGYQRIADWQKSALATIKQRPDIKTKADLDAWMGSISRLAKESAELNIADSKLAPITGKIAVSVEGLVTRPGKFIFKNPTTLSEAIAEAGGPAAHGSESHVTLYRQAARVTYNIQSRHYDPVELRPGDMLVVRAYFNPDWYGGDDSFGADPFGGGGEETSPRDMPAIVDFNSEPLFPGSGGGTSDDDSDTMRTLAAIGGGTFDDTFPEAETFTKALEAGDDPQNAYSRAKGKTSRGANFYIQAARILIEHEHESLARQVLSNLTEFDHSPVAARTMILWLIEFEQWDAAQAICAQLADHENLAIAEAALLDSARAYERNGQFKRAAEQYQGLIDSGEIDLFTTFAMTERNGLEPTGFNLDADIRIVMTSDTGRITLKITDPLGETIDNKTSRTKTGARLSESGYHQEFMIKRAIPGTYTITCENRGARNPTVQIGIFTNWGRPTQSVKWQTIQMDKSSVDLSKLEFQLPSK